MAERIRNEAGEDKGTSPVRVMKRPSRDKVKRRGLGRICDLLGLDMVRNDVEFLRLVETGLPTSSVQATCRAARLDWRCSTAAAPLRTTSAQG